MDRAFADAASAVVFHPLANLAGRRQFVHHAAHPYTKRAAAEIAAPSGTGLHRDGRFSH